MKNAKKPIILHCVLGKELKRGRQRKREREKIHSENLNALELCGFIQKKKEREKNATFRSRVMIGLKTNINR